MAWKFHEKPKTVLATKSLIDEFVNMEPAPHDRGLSERRLQVYRRILDAGHFRPVTWASATCSETGGTYRVNGKHTSVLLSGFDKVPEFHVTVERYICDTLQDVGSLYNTFDSNLASRTSNDINMAFAATIPALREAPIKLISLTVTAAAFIKGGENCKNVPPAERAEELYERQEFVGWLRKLIVSNTRNENSKPFLRGAVVSAMMSTYDRAPRVSEDFWTLVREEAAPDRDDPTRELSRFLVRAVMGTGGNTKASRPMAKVVGFRELYVKCIHAWNAWRAGEHTRLNYHPNAPLPTVSR